MNTRKPIASLFDDQTRSFVCSVAFMPLSFLGLAFFRAWAKVLQTVGAPASAHMSLPLLFNVVLAVVLVCVAVNAARLSPITSRYGMLTLGVCAMSLAGLALLANTVGVFGNAYVFEAVFTCAAVGAAFTILSWCEVYSCLSPSYVVICLSLSYIAGELMSVLVLGLQPMLRDATMACLPLFSFGGIVRSVHALPEKDRPRKKRKAGSVPWKLVVLLALFELASGLIGGRVLQDEAQGVLATLIVAAAFIVVVVFFSARIDFSAVYRTPVAILGLAVLLLPLFSAANSDVAPFFVNLSFRIFEISVFVILCDISKRMEISALFLFGIEEATVLLHTVGETLNGCFAGDAALYVPLVFTGVLTFILLMAAALLLFNKRELERDWSVSFFGAGMLEEGAERTRLIRARCERMSALKELTAREGEILWLLAQGHTNAEIGERLVIAKGTVKAHVSHIYDKLGIRTRSELNSLLSIDL